MKKPVVDYRAFRPSRINEPQYRHIWLLGGWLVYFALYLLTENLIPASRCHPMHCALDDVIPFCEYFVIPYVFWYVMVAGSLLQYFLYDVPNFRRLSKFILITQLVAMAVYIIYPSRQDLRPAVFPRENVFSWAMSVIYAADTNTGVCPSLHVAYSIGITSVFLKDKQASRFTKVFVTVATVVISLSTAFVKQHSVVDILAALLLCLLAEAIVFGREYWLPRWKGKRI